MSMSVHDFGDNQSLAHHLNRRVNVRLFHVFLPPRQDAFVTVALKYVRLCMPVRTLNRRSTGDDDATENSFVSRPPTNLRPPTGERRSFEVFGSCKYFSAVSPQIRQNSFGQIRVRLQLRYLSRDHIPLLAVRIPQSILQVFKLMWI